jgi:putative addiction module CopG family antidote
MLERLTEKDRQFIKNQVMEGYYASEIEVVRDAVRRLREKTQEEKLSHLRNLALAGHEQLAKGEGAFLDKAGMDAIMEEALSHSKKRKPIKDDVQN